MQIHWVAIVSLLPAILNYNIPMYGLWGNQFYSAWGQWMFLSLQGLAFITYLEGLEHIQVQCNLYYPNSLGPGQNVRINEGSDKRGSTIIAYYYSWSIIINQIRHHVHVYSVEKKLFIRSCCRLAERLLAAFFCWRRSSRFDAGSMSVCASSHLTHLEKHVNASLCERTAGSSAISSSSSLVLVLRSGPQTFSAIFARARCTKITIRYYYSLRSQLLLPHSIVFITLYIMHCTRRKRSDNRGVRIIEVRIKEVGLYQCT